MRLQTSCSKGCQNPTLVGLARFKQTQSTVGTVLSISTASCQPGPNNQYTVRKAPTENGAPNRARGCVAIAPEGVLGRPHVLLCQRQLLLYCLYHPLATCVWATVFFQLDWSPDLTADDVQSMHAGIREAVQALAADSCQECAPEIARLLSSP